MLGAVQRCFVTGVLLIASTAGADDPIGDWVNARVQEQQRFLRGQLPSPNASEKQLYRERPSTEPILPEFVPPTSLAPLIRLVRPGVVNISTTHSSDRRAAGAVANRSLGSGFVISPDGYVVTNSHVVDRAEQIRVRLADGREFTAEVIGRDPSTDLALLRLRGAGIGELPCTFLGDSDALSVGDWVMAIGNPFGLDHSVSHGMISAKERVIGVGMFDDFIQTDALINPGNSGGPLFNMRGEVIGVNTAIISQGQGIGFAVPINMVKDLLPNLRVNGRLARGWLGVNIHEHSAEGSGHKGAVVIDVFKNSPAAAAGIKPGDRVSAVNGKPIESYLQLLRRIAILAPGSETRLTLQREGSQKEVVVKLSERPSSEALQLLSQAGRVDTLGVVVREITPDLAGSLGVAASSGVLVAGVLPASPAEQAGIAAGDLISEVNRKRVQDLKGFRAVLEQSQGDQAVLIKLQRGEVVRYVAVKPR